MKNFSVVIFFAIVSTLMSITLLHAQEWKQIKNKNGIRVYTRSFEGSKIKEMKAVIKEEIPFEVAVELMKDPESSCEWYGMCGEMTVIKKTDTWRDYNAYFVLDVPVVTDRDVVVNAQSSIDYKNKVAYTRIHKVVDDHKKNSGLIRMKAMRSSYTVKEKNGKTEIVYQVFADIGGSLPAWVINAASVDHPYDTMVGMRTQARKEKYWRAAEKLHKKNFQADFPNLIFTK